MFSTDLERAICTMVDGILDNVEVPMDRALYMRIRTTVKKPGSASRGKRGYLHFVFQRPYGHSTSVWFQETADRDYVPDDTRWQNTSNHDSCWRSDGVSSPIANTYFKHCRKVARKLAPAALEATAEFDFGRVKVVHVEIQQEPNTYDRKLMKVVQ